MRNEKNSLAAAGITSGHLPGEPFHTYRLWDRWPEQKHPMSPVFPLTGPFSVGLSFRNFALPVHTDFLGMFLLFYPPELMRL